MHCNTSAWYNTCPFLLTSVVYTTNLSFLGGKQHSVLLPRIINMQLLTLTSLPHVDNFWEVKPRVCAIAIVVKNDY